ncbi:helix-turn-helix domain-containing protein [Streptomyces sp. NPDC088762]|uniref:helix-turn-helix domain-containing protein n=1 Tax=Streptomyces sp. NPDC088762 TaxID=3365891 RepID=UPI0038066FE2
MKKNGQHLRGSVPGDIAAVPYRPTPGTPPGIEVVPLDRLAERARSHGIDPYRPSRPVFHLLIHVRVGTIHCSVDFSTHAIGPEDWLWVRPGQVLQFLAPLEDTEGTAVVFPDGFLGDTTTALTSDAGSIRSGHMTPAARQAESLCRILGALEDEYAHLSDLPLTAHIATMRHLLSVLLIRLGHLDGAAVMGGAAGEPFRRFREAVEQDFPRTRRVEDYAARLGYSVRTLTRATRAAAGCGAKRFIDDRVLLEAKRLLVHTGLTPAAIGDRVGFTHATAFSAFFRQHTGTTPTGFRALAAGTPASGDSGTIEGRTVHASPA